MAANEKTLNKIHEFFAEYILNLLESAMTEDEDGQRHRLSAPEMSVITKFMKDNNITFAGDDDDDELALFRERAKSSALAAGFSEQDLEEAVEGLNFRSH